VGRPSHLEIYKYLQKSNCRECGVPTCLAFAAAVMKGEKRLDLCPHVEREIIEQLEARMVPRTESQDDREKALEVLRAQISSVDFSERVEALGASLAEGVLTIRCLSKGFSVDSGGLVKTDCHTTPWLIMPLFHYILHSAGRPLTGKWVPLKDLKGGKELVPSFWSAVRKASQKACGRSH